jgi:hypothetical protein
LLILGFGCSIDDRVVTVAPTPLDEPTGLSPVVEACQGIPIENDLISDFSDAREVVDSEGNAGIEFTRGPVGRGGESYFFEAGGLSRPRLSLVPTASGFSLRIDAKPGVPIDDSNQWVGFALGFARDQEVCVDATGYHGIRFTIAGSTGTCQLMTQVMISQDDRIGEGFPTASCTLGDLCYPPFSAPLAVDETPHTFEIPFTALSDGNPAPVVDELTKKTITNIGWKLYVPLSGPPCVASLSLDDVGFYK